MFFYYSSRKRPYPLVDLSLFTNFQFINGLGLIFVRSVAMFGGLFLVPFLLQGTLGYSETATGLLILPNAIMVSITLPFAGKWTDSHGYRSVSIAGLIMLGFSMFLFARLSGGGNLPFILLAMMLRGAGFGMLNTALTAAVIGAVPQQKVAMGSSVNMLILQLGGAISVSSFSLIQQVSAQHYQESGVAALPAEHHALHDCFLIAAFLLWFSIISATRLPKKEKRISENISLEAG